MLQNNAIVFWNLKGEAILTIHSDVFTSEELDSMFSYIGELRLDMYTENKPELRHRPELRVDNTSEECLEIIDLNLEED